MAPPTVTLEEFADTELRQLAAREQAATHAAASGAGPPLRYSQLAADGLEDDADKVDLATGADREWDAFRETHKKGSGNKMGKRF